RLQRRIVGVLLIGERLILEVGDRVRQEHGPGPGGRGAGDGGHDHGEDRGCRERESELHGGEPRRFDVRCTVRPMKDMLSDEIVVVGAGPAGLVAAIPLARAGVPTRVLERRTEPSTHPRATVVSTWAMEQLRRWGLAERLRAAELKVEWLGLLCDTLADPGQTFPVGYPTRAQRAVLSPEGPACVPQDLLERVLVEHLRSLPAARLVTGTEVRDPRVMDARFVIGA